VRFAHKHNLKTHMKVHRRGGLEGGWSASLGHTRTRQLQLRDPEEETDGAALNPGMTKCNIDFHAGTSSMDPFYTYLLGYLGGLASRKMGNLMICNDFIVLGG
jgi:hypothetical protein